MLHSRCLWRYVLLNPNCNLLSRNFPKRGAFFWRGGGEMLMIPVRNRQAGKERKDGAANK